MVIQTGELYYDMRRKDAFAETAESAYKQGWNLRIGK